MILKAARRSLVLVMAAWPALAQEAPKQPDIVTPPYTFSEDQVKVIAAEALAKRDAAAAEYNKWNALLSEIQKQALRIQATPPKLAEPKP